MSDAPAEGAAAPIFSMPVSGGGVAGLSDYSGKRLILFFYPRDDTPGCTTAAKGFSELADRFESVGAALLGVSRDTIAK
ncbi:MAG: peroxiredoxin, partial [Pseudomonadota bacterium]